MFLFCFLQGWDRYALRPWCLRRRARGGQVVDFVPPVVVRADDDDVDFFDAVNAIEAQGDEPEVIVID